MVPLHLFSSTVHGFLSLQLGALMWGISPSLPTMSRYKCGFASLPNAHWCVSHYQPCLKCTSFTTPDTQLCSRALASAPLQRPNHSALICFPNLSLSGISAVTQKAAIHMDHLPVSFSSVYFLYLSISLPLLCVSGSLSGCNPLL